MKEVPKLQSSAVLVPGAGIGTPIVLHQQPRLKIH